MLTNGNESAEAPALIDLGDGRFSISILDIKNGTTKDILLPYLYQLNIVELEVLCRHVPAWLELELIKLGFTRKVEKLADDQVKVIISRKPICSCG